MSEAPVDWNIPAPTANLKLTANMVVIDNAAHSPKDVLEAADRWRRLFSNQRSLRVYGAPEPSTGNFAAVLIGLSAVSVIMMLWLYL